MKSDIPVVAINSINRDYSDRKDFRPHISDLRNSGQLEYDADLVLLLHRPAMFGQAKEGESKEEFKHKAELIIAKNRLGEANFEIGYFFDGEKCLFMEMVKDGY
jgi:replicative DNA helicase